MNRDIDHGPSNLHEECYSARVRWVVVLITGYLTYTRSVIQPELVDRGIDFGPYNLHKECYSARVRWIVVLITGHLTYTRSAIQSELGGL
ncbi:hypothetical protein TorRG33x02_313550 [Trema orientale]|uniref:Uncharacterized protein n=1 Tax=Trema orientale TaxID=63057 RepID=A0A2P5BPL8_TREOI|nr:hypothetical protein TorRG33x02_313550 [Trema orientale]